MRFLMREGPIMKEDTFHICWFADVESVDMEDERARRMWVQMVLSRGKKEDVTRLSIEEIKRFLPDLFLSMEVKELWSEYLQD